MTEFTRGGGARNSPFIRLKSAVEAFSVAELMITIVIVAILAAVTIPILNNAKPDENELMHKKATFIVERVVNELVTDEFLYPENAVMTGLGNLSQVQVNGGSHEGTTKFCSLFASRINKAPNTRVVCEKDAKSVTSIEGIDWYLPVSDFAGDDFEIIKVDVNGAKKPNCLYDKDNCKRPDQFKYQVRKGTKVPVREVQDFGATAPPKAREDMGAAPDSGANDPRTAQRWWGIYCTVKGPGNVYGTGDKKPNGHYQLVAIASPGYKGSWFTKNVTIKDNDVTDCDVTFTPNDNVPTTDGGTTTPPVTPPVTPPKDPDEDKTKTYCIDKVVTGETTKCKIGGANPKECGKTPGKYPLTSTFDDGYEAIWKSANPISIVDKDVTATLECVKKEDDKCYNITASITGMCAVAGTGCKAPGTYNLTITPKDGYSYNNSTSASNKQVVLGTSDVNVAISCMAPPPKNPDACCETAYGSGAKFIKSKNKCVLDKGLITQSWDCKNKPEYCIGPIKGFQFATSVWPSAYKTCIDSKMSLPSISELESLYNARSSVFAPSTSNPNVYGYWTTTGNGSPYGCETFRYLHVPTTGQVHSACHTHPHVKAMCVGAAPAICATEPGPDPGGDNGYISAKITSSAQAGVHAGTAGYSVNWTNVTGSRKYVVRAASIVYYHKYYYTYYGVTSGASGSQSGTITNIPKYVTGDKIYLTVTFE